VVERNKFKVKRATVQLAFERACAARKRRALFAARSHGKAGMPAAPSAMIDAIQRAVVD